MPVRSTSEIFCQAEYVCQKWQIYSKPKQVNGSLKSISQVRKSEEQLLATFDKFSFFLKVEKKKKVAKRGKVKLNNNVLKSLKKNKK